MRAESSHKQAWSLSPRRSPCAGLFAARRNCDEKDLDQRSLSVSELQQLDFSFALRLPPRNIPHPNIQGGLTRQQANIFVD